MSDDESPGYRARISDLPAGERARERFQRLGPQALTTAKLLAILLRTGSATEDVLLLASRVLRERHGLRGLAGADPPTLAGVHGLGTAKASTIAAPLSWAAVWRWRATPCDQR